MVFALHCIGQELAVRVIVEPILKVTSSLYHVVVLVAAGCSSTLFKHTSDDMLAGSNCNKTYANIELL